ncbi:ABC-type sugar transport system ATPase subunit [Bradyrhizobium sp. LM2.9]
MADVSLRKVIKRYDDVEAVRGIDLDISDHEFIVLVGPSGCGKSTTLRMIAGLEDITDGDIMIGGDVVNDVPPKDRDIAMVFQNYALYPHMTVAENMSFGLRLKHYPKAEIKARVTEAARLLDITDLIDRKPKQLSGGQRQRVAMGRAIVRNPKVFLFDEPLSNLDAKLRVQMRIEIKKVHQKVRTTTVYVTHDQVEAMTLADRVVVMNKGRIEQIGTPNELYHKPATRFVAGFIGSPAMNFLPCRLEDAGGTLQIRLTDRIAFALPPGPRHSLQRTAAHRQAPARHPARASHRVARASGAGCRNLRHRARRHRADGHGDPGLFRARGHARLRPCRSQCRRCGRGSHAFGDGPQQYAPAKRRDRRRVVTPVLETRAGGEQWRPTKRRFSLHKLCRKARAPSSPSEMTSSSSSFRT